MGSARADCRPPGLGFVLAARGADRIVLGRRRLAVAGKGRRISRSLFFFPKRTRVSAESAERGQPGPTRDARRRGAEATIRPDCPLAPALFLFVSFVSFFLCLF